MAKKVLLCGEVLKIMAGRYMVQQSGKKDQRKASFRAI